MNIRVNRFLILPDWHVSNLGSRVLSLVERRMARDWEDIFGHVVLLMEKISPPTLYLHSVNSPSIWLWNVRLIISSLSIENCCHYIIVWNYDEDRCRIATCYGPENMTRLRRFAVDLIKSKGVRSVPQKMRQLMRNVRMVFDYLRMTNNSRAYTTKK